MKKYRKFLLWCEKHYIIVVILNFFWSLMCGTGLGILLGYNTVNGSKQRMEIKEDIKAIQEMAFKHYKDSTTKVADSIKTHLYKNIDNANRN